MNKSKVAYTARLAVWWMFILLGLADCMTVRQTSDLRCLYSRLDFFPCEQDSSTRTPAVNEYAEYRTRIRYFVPDCIYRNPKSYPLSEIIRRIDTLGNPNVRLLYSPGYTINETYKDNLLVSYNVQCPAGRLPFLDFIHFDLQPIEDCFDRCEDYVTVSCTGCGVSESCGTEPTGNDYTLEEEHFSVTFRSSASERYTGFALSVICFDPMEITAPNDDDDDGDDEDTSVSRRKRNLNGLLKVWQKHAARVQANAALADKVTLLPLPTETSPLRLLAFNITLGDIMTYEANVIIVKRRGQVIGRIRNIRRLRIHDRNGHDHTFCRKAAMRNALGEITRNQLRGVGHIVVISDQAHFLRYYESIVLTSQEREVLRNLSTELFDLIPRENSDDFEDEPDDYGNYEYTTNDVSRTSTIQKSVPPPPLPRRLISISAIHTAIVCESQSSNPVIRTAAAVVLSIAEHQNSTKVAKEREMINRNPIRTEMPIIPERAAPPTPDPDIVPPMMIQLTKSEYGEDAHSTFAHKLW